MKAFGVTGFDRLTAISDRAARCGRAVTASAQWLSSTSADQQDLGQVRVYFN